MKGMSSLAKSSFSFSVVCYLFSVLYHQQVWPKVFSGPYRHLQEWFFHAIQPRMERSFMQVPETFMTTPEVIANRGYPVEIHHVMTEDGYILELHRIPHGRYDRFGDDGTFQRKAVFLQPGMFCNDIIWLLSSNNNSLAYILADQGYDVWLGNSRGNTYSRKHVKLNPNEDKDYWNFSWDEMGRYDVPASVDYVLNVTGQAKLAAFVGYSLGSGLFFIGANNDQSRLNDQTEMVIGLAPTVNVAHLSNYYRYLAPFVKLYQWYQDWAGVGEVHANNGLLHLITRLICETSSTGGIWGIEWLFGVFGPSEHYSEVDLMRLLGHHPAGGSANTMAHFLQTYNSGDFLHFDYGVAGNLERYGTSTPPAYNLTLVTAPVYLIYADTDPFTSSEDTAWLMARLGNLKEAIKIPSFSHGDFIWSSRAGELVHYPIADLLPPPFVYKNNSILALQF